MKFLRFVTLLLAVLIVYLAQILLIDVNLADLLPPTLLDFLPSLRSLLIWSPANLQSLALLGLAIGGVIYGLIVQPWSARSTPYPRPNGNPFVAAGGAAITLAVGLGIVLLLLGMNGVAETRIVQWTWVASLGIFLGGSWLLTPRSVQTKANNTPEASWPVLLLIVAVAAILYSWHLALIPARVDEEVAGHGLQAMSVLSGEESRIFAPGWENRPLLAYYPAALGMLFSGDWVIGNRLAGVYAGLLTLVGVWLLGCELFRRPATVDGLGRMLDDDGRHAALLAAAFTGIGYTFLHFARLPGVMEPVAWGTLALWAFVHGVRTNSRLALALGGLLLGLTMLLYESGFIFPIVAIVWLLFFLFARMAWLKAAHGGPGWVGIGVWLAGILVFVAPALGTWLHAPYALWQRVETMTIFNPSLRLQMESAYGVQGIWALLWENLRRTALTFNLYGDTSTLFGYTEPMLDPLLGPILVLGIGVLLLNLDRLLSWQLLMWLGTVILLGGALTVDAPYWPRLLPALPATGLIMALAVDRWRATLLQISGPWLRHVGTVLVIGVLALAAVHNWINYYERYTIGAELTTHIGRTLRSLPPEQIPFLVVGESRPTWNNQQVEYLGAVDYRTLQLGELQAEMLPETMPPHSVIILFPNDRALASLLETRYPGGVYYVQRDRRSNPMLVLYELP